MIDWQDVLYFTILARTGSFSAAARKLRVNHATVGRRVAALERALDLRLVDRLPRRVVLTRDGRAVAKLAGGMEDRVDAIRRYAHGAQDTATVQVSASPAVAALLIASGVGRFHDKNPGIKIVLLGTSGNAALNRGEADIAVRLSRPKAPDLIVRRIGMMRFALYATPTLAASPETQWTFIGYTPDLEHVTQQVWLRGLLDGRPIVFQASDLFGQQAAARASLGAVVLPHFMGDPDPSLVRVPTRTSPPERDMWLVTYPDLRRSFAIRTVMDFLAEDIGKGCPLTLGRG